MIFSWFEVKLKGSLGGLAFSETEGGVMTDLELALELPRAIGHAPRGGRFRLRRQRAQQREVGTMHPRLVQRLRRGGHAQRAEQRQRHVAVREQLRTHHVAVRDYF